MKRFLVALAVCLTAASIFAAQCAGTTKAGKRCKREAAEGSKYCIGHADQAAAKTATDKAPADAKLKDDGTCWAITEAGKRCKRKKDGESDYCKQHGPNVKAKKPGGQCRALKWDGKRCTRKAEGEYLYCSQHRKQPAGEPAKKAAPKPAAK